MKRWRYYWAWCRHYVGLWELIGLVGGVACAAGVGWIYPPGGVILGGVEMLCVAYLGARSGA
jgi:hypothetical protein